MTYDFTTIMDRRGMDAMAVDGLGSGWAPDAPKDGFDAIPMWVADMNFPACPTIPEAIIERTKHPHYGYFAPRDEYFNSIIKWQDGRMFGGTHTIRMNLALPKSRVEEAFERLKKYVL